MVKTKDQSSSKMVSVAAFYWSEVSPHGVGVRERFIEEMKKWDESFVIDMFYVRDILETVLKNVLAE